jgi:predicted N-acetyltransferase YhbS
MWEIRPEEASDGPLVRTLVAKSFGPGRYAKSAYRLREGVAAEAGLSFVAVEAGVLRASVRFWPIAIGAEHVLLLGPLAVDTGQRGRGIGIALMNRGIEEARARGHRAIILVGDAPYYARAGFAPVAPGSMKFPGPVDPARILGLDLIGGAMDWAAGEVRRACVDDPVCADGAPLASRNFHDRHSACQQTVE